MWRGLKRKKEPEGEGRAEERNDGGNNKKKKKRCGSGEARSDLRNGN